MSQLSNNDCLLVPLNDRDYAQGPTDAPIQLVEYGDYQSPKCGKAYRMIKAAQQQLGNQLCFVFRHFPQTQIHMNAQRAAEAAEAAAAQGKFWEMHDALFEHQQTLGNGYLVEYAYLLGLDVSLFLRDLSSHVYAKQVKEDIESGRYTGVTSAPTLFINGIRYKDSWVLERLLATISSTSF
ncbi:hypothetical protein NUACC21_63430 [Scytonema sp. NUACC21]